MRSIPSTLFAMLLAAALPSAAQKAAPVLAPPEDGGPRNWDVVGVARAVNVRAGPSLEADVTGTFLLGATLDNLGCLRGVSEVWCDVQPLGGGPRGFVAARFLEPTVSPDGSAAYGPDDSALRAGEGDFDATGEIPCAFSASQPMSRCEFGVARAGGGYATVIIQRPSSHSRAVFFRLGKPIGANTSQADGYPAFSASKAGDLNRIRIGEERYEIPDAVVLGG